MKLWISSIQKPNMNSWQRRFIGATGGPLQNLPIVCGGSQNRNYYLTSQVVIGQPEIEMKMIDQIQTSVSKILNVGSQGPELRFT